ncbi:YolD-like family protein [Paenibacillus qinlingensis]|uniref:YolD-like family protein n=1 Tax=Paenibacillus qinlingensis TaxID=1837343 RepID=UPI001566E2C7|nr:YolD-like family protein [Paenibacillus qinlingensis]NQX58555.1 YolD-like family protein [Paenibacillus qinlingensis]
MSKKLEMNGLWESSRMMLPQHKESAIRVQEEKQYIQRQVLDEQEIHFISATLSQSQIYKRTVQLTVYDKYHPRTISGVVTRSKHGEFRLDTIDPFSGAEDWDWIRFQDVLKAELCKECDEIIDQ